jgi:thiamine-phosphate pyrophosphorylase
MKSINLKEAMKLYAVTDRTWLKGKTLSEQVNQAIQGGITFLQLREKELDDNQFLEEAKLMKTLCSDIPFVINDNIEIALKSNADGVHIGQSDIGLFDARIKLGQDKIIGVSVQTVAQAIEAESNGADYLGVGAVFGTHTKLDANILDHQVVKDICHAVDIPIVAIGGINLNNIKQLTGTDIDGVAVVSAIFAQNDIMSATHKLLESVDSIL